MTFAAFPSDLDALLIADGCLVIASAGLTALLLATMPRTSPRSWSSYTPHITRAAADLRARKHAVDRAQRLDPNGNALKPADLLRDGGRHGDGR